MEEVNEHDRDALFSRIANRLRTTALKERGRTTTTDYAVAFTLYEIERLGYKIMKEEKMQPYQMPTEEAWEEENLEEKSIAKWQESPQLKEAYFDELRDAAATIAGVNNSITIEDKAEWFDRFQGMCKEIQSKYTSTKIIWEYWEDEDD